MLIRVIDFETGGLEPESGICEVGWTDIEDGLITNTDAYLCDPGRPISVEAMAVHHIRNEEVAGLPPALYNLAHMDQDVDVFCAHNAEFEKSFWPQRPEVVPWICTYKVAVRTHPEALRHSNQYLRYDLGLPCDPERASPAHRAGPDTYVTALLLLELLKWATIEEMIHWSSGPALLPRIPVGKYRGLKWEEVPTHWLKWVVISSDLNHTIKVNANHELKKREQG